MSDAINDILEERRHQVEDIGFTSEHDGQHDKGELCRAAAGYADHAADVIENGPDANFDVPCDWPWSDMCWRPKDPRTDLVRAAALIVAEIERLDRASGSEASWRQRVITEKAVLDEKRRKLGAFKESDAFGRLHWEYQELLNTQGHLMTAYSAVLGERVARFEERAE